jgi:hypothetical protein
MSLIYKFVFPIFLVGCNHLFYQPLPQTILTPERVDVTWTELTLSTPDGETLAAWRLDAVGQKLGTVLHFHGNAENMTTHFLYVAWLTQFGYDVVTFDYRGYGQSTGFPTRAGVILDGVSAIQYADALDGPLFIVAQSLGGAIAVPSVVEANAKSLRALVIDSSFASYRDVAQMKLNDLWLTWAFQVPLSWTISRDLEPVEFAPKLNVPVLSIHGDRDPVVPLAQGRQLYDAVGSEQKDFWLLKGGGHTVAFAREDSPFRKKQLRFLCLHHEQQATCQAVTDKRLKSIE